MSRNVRLLWLSYLIWGFGEGLFVYFEPLFLEQIGASYHQISLAFAASAIVVTFLYLPAGWLGDRIERRRLILGGYWLGVVAALIMAFAPTWYMFALGMVVYSLCSYCVPVINAYVLHETPPAMQTRILNRLTAAFWLGLLAAPTLGGRLAETGGRVLVFGCVALAFLVSSGCAWGIAPQTSPVVRGSLVRTRTDWRHLSVLWPIVGLLVILAAFEWGARLGDVLLPNYLVHRFAYDMRTIGILGTLNSIGAIVWLLVLSEIDARGRKALFIATANVAIGIWLLWKMPSWGMHMVAFALLGARHAFRSLGTVLLARLTPQAYQSTITGLFYMFSGLAISLAELLSGPLFTQDPARPLEVAFWWLLVWIGLFGGYGLVFRHLRRRSPIPSEA
nr:MFS transporter [Ardenticatena sp.]